MSDIPSPGQIYRHFKGNLYRVVVLAEHSETGERLVVYQALYGELRIYACPLSVFTERLDQDKYPEYASRCRFELQKEVIAAPVTDAVPRAHPKAHSLEEPVYKEDTPNLQKNAGKEPEISAGMLENSRDKKEAQGTDSKAGEEELHLDPLVLEFLDAGTHEERLNILSALHNRITDEMINTMAVALDVEIREEEDTEKRYEELRACLHTFKRYESSRLR